MIFTLKKLLFGRGRSSLNLFLALPILILVSAGCLCSGRNETQSCITVDGANLVLAGSDLQIIRLADGAVTHAEKTRYSDVVCTEENEIITVKQELVKKGRESRPQRIAVWRNAAKSFQLADIESFQKYLGVIQNRYFISGSRGFVEKTQTVGSGKNSHTERYNVYDQPQIFSLEDSTTGELKSHYLYREKLGLPETVLYDDLWFYPVSVDESGSLFFAMYNKIDCVAILHKINMFDGTIKPTGVSVSLPKDMRFLKSVAADKAGKFIAFIYEGTVDNRSRTLINGLNTRTNQTVVSNTILGISFNYGSPQLVFEETGKRLAIFVEGLRYAPSQGVFEITIFDLETGTEISNIDAKGLLKDPTDVGLIRFIGDDLLLTYYHKKTIRDPENRLCKVNLLTKQIVWDIKVAM